jgi:hypothetical protein
MKWNPATDEVDNVLGLPKGQLIGDMGFRIEVSFYTPEVMKIAKALKANGVDKTVYSQAGVMILGQQSDLECMSEYLPLSGG